MWRWRRRRRCGEGSAGGAAGGVVGGVEENGYKPWVVNDLGLKKQLRQRATPPRERGVGGVGQFVVALGSGVGDGRLGDAHAEGCKSFGGGGGGGGVGGAFRGSGRAGDRTG